MPSMAAAMTSPSTNQDASMNGNPEVSPQRRKQGRNHSPMAWNLRNP